MPSLTTLLTVSLGLRLVILLYGLYIDATSPIKFTDIDYFVFTDASSFLANNASPYDRETYRYTPLLAYLLLPNVNWKPWGKVIFIFGDLLAVVGMVKVLEGRVGRSRAIKYTAATWGWNPFVAVISARGSSEGILGAMVVAFVWAIEKRWLVTAGALLGLATHWKIYPVVYAPSVIWWIGGTGEFKKGWKSAVTGFVSVERVKFGVAALGVFAALNLWMYSLSVFP